MKKAIILITFFFGFLTCVLPQVDTVGVPEEPVLEGVSVNSSGNVLIEWSLSPSPDVAGYIIYIWADTIDGNLAIDTIHEPYATSYLYLSTIANQNSELFGIAAWDSSDNFSSITTHHNTIFSSVKYDSCQASMEITWNSYSGWEGDINRYNILFRTESNPYSILSAITSGDTTYTHQNISENTTHSYYIEAIKNDGKSSSSNRAGHYTAMPRPPQYINADYASVLSDNEISVSFSIDNNSEIFYYKLLRGSSYSGSYDTITSSQNQTSGSFSHTDTQVNTTNIYYYILAAINSCNNIARESNTTNNIVLRATNKNMINTLEWNHIKNWGGGIQEYNIYRIIGEESPELLFTNGPTDSTYTDDIESLQNSGVVGKFCYYVEAIEGNGNQYGVIGTSKSNLSCTSITPKIYIPDAFTPNGDDKNDRFYPFISFTPKKFLMIIYNRWGNKIFETTDIQNGWDGKVKNGDPAKEGVYIYHLKFITSDNLVIEKNGHLTLFY